MKTSVLMQWILLLQYIGILVFSIIEGSWGKGLYWLGAIILLLGVIIGMK